MSKRAILTTVIIIIISLLVVTFATQNAEVVNVKLWLVNFKISLSLLIVFSLLIGAIVSWFFLYKELKNRQRLIEEKDILIKKLKEELSAKDFLNIDV